MAKAMTKPTVVRLVPKDESAKEAMLTALRSWMKDVKSGSVTQLMVCGMVNGQIENSTVGELTSMIGLCEVTKASLIDEMMEGPDDEYEPEDGTPHEDEEEDEGEDAP